LVAVAAAGCEPAPPVPAGTGAREAALAFYRAVIRRDWDGAYAVLDADSRARCGRARFATLADAYWAGLRFEPAGVQVSSCEEQGERALAHVVLTGRTSSHQRYKDAAALRKDAAGWAVVLPPQFAKAKPL
jgi:hypothetical protein